MHKSQLVLFFIFLSQNLSKHLYFLVLPLLECEHEALHLIARSFLQRAEIVELLLLIEILRLYVLVIIFLSLIQGFGLLQLLLYAKNVLL